MKKIILLRHAKSSWEDTGLDDHDRPLNARGKKAAPVIGSWLAHRKHHPDLILCSSAVRTQETVALLGQTMPNLPDPLTERGLYHASPGDMLVRLTLIDPSVNTVMLVGHQPGLSSLARKLADGHENRRCKRAYEHFPTAAAAVFEVSLDDWADLAFEKARFVDFAKPRELMDA